MRIWNVVLGGAVAAGLALSLATPASAATVEPNTIPPAATTGGAHTDSGWLGTCHPVRYTRSAGGWCDGNGPDWRYFGWVYCTDGRDYHGPSRWAGDRSGFRKMKLEINKLKLYDFINNK